MTRSRSIATSRHRVLIVVLILLIAALPLNTARVYSLYAQIYQEPPPAPAPPPVGAPPPAPGPYPGPGSNVVTGQNFERALTRESLHTSFDPERLVENETTRFTASVVYARQ